MTIQSVQQIIEQMRGALKEDNSDLHTFPQYGNLYSIYRSVALVVQEQNTKLDSLNSNLFLSTASGESLDNKASDFNIFRLQGQRSSGSVIVIGKISEVVADTILTHTNTGLQFQVQNRTVLIGGRAVVSVQSTEFTSFANLEPGTELTNSLYPNVRFIVGASFDPISNQYVGGLYGGREEETDDELRSRVLETINSFGTSNTRVFKQQVLNIEGISKVDVSENNPSLGYITIYVDNADQQIIKQAEIILSRVKPIGTALIIKPFSFVSVDIVMTITTFNQRNLTDLERNIRLSLEDYISNISFNNELTKEGLAGAVYNLEDVVNVKVINPSSSISIKKEEILNLGSLTINYK